MKLGTQLKGALMVMSAVSLYCVWVNGRISATAKTKDNESQSWPSSSRYTTAQSRLIFSPPDNKTSTLPKWLQEYMQWHREQLVRLQSAEVSWTEQRLLIVRCIDGDRCGGTADRLKSLPFCFAVAAQTKRLLFLRWNRPFTLEEFVVPGDQLNWTIPQTLVSLLATNSSNLTRIFFEGANAVENIVISAPKSHIWLVETAAQLTGGYYFRKIVKDLEQLSKASRVVEAPVFFHEMFLALFRPVPSLRKLVEQQLDGLDLIPDQFVTAHIRAKYPLEPYRETSNLTLLQYTVTNAVDCASSLSSNLPVYVASDTLAALLLAQEYGKYPSTPRVVSYLDVPVGSLTSDHLPSGITESKEAVFLPHRDPPHLNFAKDEDPSAFFSIFVDLFIMSQSRCVSFGSGGFGRFGTLVSFNSSCRVAHSTMGKLNNCTGP